MNMQDAVVRPFNPENGLAGLPAVETRFPGIRFRDIRPNYDEEYLIEDVMPAQGVMFVYGDPEAGKTFCVLDCGVHIAAGRMWNEKEIMQGYVAYFAAESGQGFLKRVEAAKKGLGLAGADLPLWVYTDVPDIGAKTGDIDAIERALDRDVSAHGATPRLIVFDTLNKVTAGHDENSAAEMGVLVTNGYRLAAKFKCLVLIVHHPGKTGSEGMRGSGALRGGGDAVWRVRGGVGEPKTVEVERMKDGPSHLSWSFDLAVEEIGKNRKGKPVTSCFVRPLSSPSVGAAPVRRQKEKPLRGHRAAMFQVVQKALEEAGETPPASKHITATRAVKFERVLAYAKQKGFADTNSEASWPKAVARALRDLDGDGVVGRWGDWLWLK